MASALPRKRLMRPQASKPGTFTHTLRRTAATYLGKLKVQPQVILCVLAQRVLASVPLHVTTLAPFQIGRRVIATKYLVTGRESTRTAIIVDSQSVKTVGAPAASTPPGKLKLAGDKSPRYARFSD
jgi:hypothetical protein